jgi:hypothetical protein
MGCWHALFRVLFGGHHTEFVQSTLRSAHYSIWVQKRPRARHHCALAIFSWQYKQKEISPQHDTTGKHPLQSAKNHFQ